MVLLHVKPFAFIYVFCVPPIWKLCCELLEVLYISVEPFIPKSYQLFGLLLKHKHNLQPAYVVFNGRPVEKFINPVYVPPVFGK